MSLSWPAPGKLNLALHITGRRDDGYHLLQTIFQFVDHHDLLDFRVREDGAILRCSDWEGVMAEDDIAVRAAKLMQQECSCRLGVDINLQKKLPIGGGLGGGSSDAATTLVALNYLWGIHLPVRRLLSLGLELGADVPFFILGRAAYAEGIGERLTPIASEQLWYLIIQPDCQVSTAEIFRAPSLIRNTPAINIPDLLLQADNNCQPVVRKLYPQVAKAIDWLNQFGHARITGTGCCVFAGFYQQQQAEFIYESLPRYWKGFVAKGLNYSPLLARLEQEKQHYH